MSFFESLEPAPADPIFGLQARYMADPRKEKIDLGAGVYKTADLKPLILESVKKAEALLLQTEKSKDYLPIDGLRDYMATTEQLVFGERNEKIYGAQTAGATAALRVGGAFFKENGLKTIHIPQPTWANHRRLFQHAGFEIKNYPYVKSNRFDFQGLQEYLNTLEKGAMVLLHGCCHNPTGFDPTLEEWHSLCSTFQQRSLFPFFDLSYQGFGRSLEEDVAPIRYFVGQGIQCAVAVSHSKNFGLYAERCGALFIVCTDKGVADKIGSHVKVLIRGLFSNPPCHGARIVSTILLNSQLSALWKGEVEGMRGRIMTMRAALVDRLIAGGGNFHFLRRQNGMFSYTGLSSIQVKRLTDEYGIYLPDDGRISIAGLNQENVSYVAQAILDCEKKKL